MTSPRLLHEAGLTALTAPVKFGGGGAGLHEAAEVVRECREDAIYVAPDCENPTDVDKEEIVASGLLGEFRRNHGWDEWAADPRYSNEHWRMESVFLRARDIAIAEAAAKRKNEQR